MANRKRNHPFSVRLTDDEYSLWEKLHKASGISKTDYFVQRLKSTYIQIFYFSEGIKILHRELRKVGVNLNQIAYHSNSGQSQQAKHLLFEMSETYGAVMLRFKKFLEQPLINAVFMKIDEIPDDFNPLKSEKKKE